MYVFSSVITILTIYKKVCNVLYIWSKYDMHTVYYYLEI